MFLVYLDPVKVKQKVMVTGHTSQSGDENVPLSAESAH